MADRPNPGDLWGGMSTGWTVTSYLLSGLLALGGIGWLIDHLAGTGQIFTAIGMPIGAALSIYLVYVKYGKDQDEKPRP
jgi:ATP synthase protein I